MVPMHLPSDKLILIQLITIRGTIMERHSGLISLPSNLATRRGFYL